MPNMKYGEVQEIDFRVKNPAKTATVRIPTASEWLERMRVQKSTRKNLGRRKSTTTMQPNRPADLALFKAIQVAGDEFDEFEASHYIGLMADVSVIDAIRDGGGYRIILEWNYGGALQGTTSHVIGIPTVRDVTEYRRGIVTVTDLPHGLEELTYHLQPAINLYNSLIKTTEGYADGVEVPPIHKGPVISELIQLCDALNEDELPESEEGFRSGSGQSPTPQASAS